MKTLDIEAELRRAVDHREFRVVYQPIVNLERDGAFVETEDTLVAVAEPEPLRATRRTIPFAHSATNAS